MIRSSCRLSRAYTSHRLQPCPPRRLLAVAATATADPKPASYASPTDHDRSHDDHSLRQIFDSRKFWRAFSRTSTAKPNCGLFQNIYLTQPTGFVRYAQVTQRVCQRIVGEVLSASSTEEYIAIPRRLDLLSDSLCRVLDTADFVRATHPDARFQAAATQAYGYLFEYMNVLNTTPGLKSQLLKAISTPEISKAWNEEEITVAKILLKDFAQSAIDLPETKRQRFVELSSHMKKLGHDFVESMASRTNYLEFDVGQLKGINPMLLGQHSIGRRKVRLPTGGDISYAALQSVEDENMRREVYIHGRQSSTNQIYTLERLMETRAEIASLSGYQSYSHMSLTDKLAKSPEAVHSFLTALSTDNTPRVMQETETMQILKNQASAPDKIQPWDVLYYQSLLNSNVQTKSRKPDFVSAYFSLGTVMQGLSRLFTRLYGIRFVPQETNSGETWNDDVRRLNVFHETEGHVAVLYCDLFGRAGKSPNPTHFTLRCSRHISPSELAGSQSPQETNDGMATSYNSERNQHYQLPTIALICDFPHPSSASTPTLLTFQEVRTIFHEMGHAIHSILGRTSLQIVSGTRCPTDFAELPSVLMESFAADRSVLELFARHWETDAPLPYEMVEESLEMQRRGQGLQTETQILFSLLDQAYHSSLPLTMEGGFDSSKVFFDIYDKYGSLREPRDTTAQGLFGHLVEYGGTYYSYLFDRAIAGKIWKEIFGSGNDGGGVDREAGERYKKEVLKWGGGRSGWACISGVLGDDRLKDGGREAMEEVGRWGVHD